MTHLPSRLALPACTSHPPVVLCVWDLTDMQDRIEYVQIQLRAPRGSPPRLENSTIAAWLLMITNVSCFTYILNGCER
ncbi:unnamed protein product [Allacma fusca]|uniref:Uncharacterized protein n=1 Tax=Allacma fusca TaxID=39272 RepID=A0A8J2K9D3_9HEXA|nr:unnamed protein product [Allacma fusca]